MKMFHTSAFSPPTIAAMTQALHDAVDTLPDQTPAGRVQALARNIVDLAAEGERDPERLKAKALAALKAWE
jgi:hypothetical protein